jgi:hypothetical protein
MGFVTLLLDVTVCYRYWLLTTAIASVSLNIFSSRAGPEAACLDTGLTVWYVT